MNELALFCGNKCTRESAPDVAPQELRKEEQMGGPVNCSDSELCTFLQALEAGFLPTYYSETSPSVQSKSMSIASKSYRRGKQTVLFHGFPSLQMSQNLTEDIGEELLTWFREGFLAKTLAQQEQTAATKERDLTEASQDCGASLPESLAKLNQNGFWLKTPITCEPRVLDEFSKIWPASGMMLRGECYPLKTVEPITNENECGLLPTPTTMGNQLAPSMMKHAGCRNLQNFLKQLPTPTAHNAKEGGYPAEGTRNTPTQGWEVGGKIPPILTEWMMGWPIGWTDLKPLEMDKFQSWQQQHSIS